MRFEDGVDLIVGNELRRLLMRRERNEDHTLHLRQRPHAGLRAPPIVTPVEDDPLGLELRDLEARQCRPASSAWTHRVP